MKKTDYNYNYNKKAYIGSLIFLIVLAIISGYLAFKFSSKLEDDMYALGFVCACVLLIFVLSVLFIHAIGYLKGKRKLVHDKIEIIKTNPFIYYRELPNPYGVGVASLLLDSKLENEKDIVAVILNLCAKKYLSLKNENGIYIINILKDIDGDLLANEKYIMEMVVENNLKDLNYDEWFNLCMQDGLSLSLFTEPEKYIQSNEILKSVYVGGQRNSLKKYLEPTEKGTKELQKLLSFKSFLADFGQFADKNPEEIILWEYYLCYAHVFGLTDKMLKTGYEKLVKNGSFEITDLESIRLKEVKILKERK